MGFFQFFGENLKFFLKTFVVIFFAKTSNSLSKKRQFFGGNIFKIITSVPAPVQGIDPKRYKEVPTLNGDDTFGFNRRDCSIFNQHL
jgi:hypothetical protein